MTRWRWRTGRVLLGVGFLAFGVLIALLLRGGEGSDRAPAPAGQALSIQSAPGGPACPGRSEREPVPADLQATAAARPGDIPGPPSAGPTDSGQRDILAVRVLSPDGRPAPGSEVRLELYESLPENGWRFLAARGRTDEQGLCWLTAERQPVEGAVGSVFASAGNTLVSDVAELRFPWPATIQLLRLRAAGALEVLVEDPDGLPVPRASVSLTYRDHPNTKVSAPDDTGEDGKLSASGLPAGTYRVQVREKRTLRFAEEWAEIADGATSHVKILLPPAVLAVAGRVLDESGAPLTGIEVSLSASASSLGREVTDEEGVFEWSCAQAERVRVAVDPRGGRYEPEIEEVPFGTTGLLFRRLRAVAASAIRVEVSDTMGRPLAEAGVLLYQDKPLGAARWVGAGEDAEEWQACDISRFVATARGYRDVAGDLLPHLDRSGDVPVLRLALVSGTARETWVVDWRGEEGDVPLAEVAAFIDGRQVGTTDACGCIRIDSDDPDPAVRLVLEGYEPELWHPQRERIEMPRLDHRCWKPGRTQVVLRRREQDEGR